MTSGTKPRPIELLVYFPDGELCEGAGLVTSAVIPCEPSALVVGSVELVRTVSYHHPLRHSLQELLLENETHREVMAHDDFAETSMFSDRVEHLSSLEVPDVAMGSTHGRIVDVTWSVEVHARGADVDPRTARRGVVVRSAAWNPGSASQAPPRVEHHGLAVVGFVNVSSRKLRMGTQLTGDVQVEPLVPGSPRGIRVELVRVETIYHQPDTRHPHLGVRKFETAVAVQRLAQWPELKPEHLERLPFRIAVPPHQCSPTILTPDFSIRWVLRAVVDEPFRHDPIAELELESASSREIA